MVQAVVCRRMLIIYYTAMNKNVLTNVPVIRPIKNGHLLYEHLGIFTADWHEHTQGQLIYAENGLLHLYVADYRLLIPARYCAWVPAHTRHKLISYSADLLINTIFLEVAQEDHPFYKQTGIYQVHLLLDEQLRYAKHRQYHTPDEQTERCFYHQLKKLLPTLCTEKLLLALPAPQSIQLSKIITYLSENILLRHSTSEVARQFGISERTLSRLFQKEMGMSMCFFLKTFKVMKALELLDAGKDNICQVSYKLGYDSVADCCNFFQEILGYSPQIHLQKKLPVLQ